MMWACEPSDKRQADPQDPIEVTSMSLGTAYPLFSNARIRPADAQGRIVSFIAHTPLPSHYTSLSMWM